MHRLVFCDWDGTTSTYTEGVRPVVREAIREVVDAGLYFTISTGRPYQGLDSLAGPLGVNAPYICCNGALIVEPATGHVLRVQPTPLPLAKEFLRVSAVEGWQGMAHRDDLLTSLAYDPAERCYVIRRGRTVVREATDLDAELTRPPHKLAIHTPSRESTAAIVARAREYFGDQIRVLASSPQLVEFILPGVSKAQGMAFVAAHLGVDQQDTVAVGDGDNDVEMLEWAGVGIAMGNATPAVKAVADYQVPPVEEDGLVVALRRHVLGR